MFLIPRSEKHKFICKSFWIFKNFPKKKKRKKKKLLDVEVVFPFDSILFSFVFPQKIKFNKMDLLVKEFIAVDL